MPHQSVLPVGPVYQDYREAHINYVQGNQINYHTIQQQPALTASSTYEASLATLNPVDRTPYYETLSKCFPGSRQWIIDKVYAWLDDYEAPNVFWLSGGEGSGKTTLARTLVSNIKKAGRLGSYFFCERGDSILSNPIVIWRTIAFDLAHRDAEVGRRIARNIRQNKVDPAMADLELHFQMLIEEPLRKHWEEKWKQWVTSPKENEATGRRCPPMGDLSSVSTSQEDLLMRFPVIVIDALDECGPAPSQLAHRQAFLGTIARWAALHPCLKLLITSREQPTIVAPDFRSLCRHIDLHIGFDIQNIDPRIDHDIQYYFERCFSKIAADQEAPLPTQWPGPYVIKWLTCCAGGSYRWADVVIHYLEQGVATLKLDMVIAGSVHGKGTDIDTIKKVITNFPFHKWQSWIASTSVETLLGTSSSPPKEHIVEKHNIPPRKWWRRGSLMHKENDGQRKRSHSSVQVNGNGRRRGTHDSVQEDSLMTGSTSEISELGQKIGASFYDIPLRTC